MTEHPTAYIDEIARDTYRISVAMPPCVIPGGFTFNQYLVVDDLPLLFHTGPRKLFPLVSAQIRKVMPIEALRYIGFSHVEADECGALAELLALAPDAQPVCSQVGAIVSVGDLVDRTPLGLADGQPLDLGHHRLRWQSTPHLPHGWDCGYLFDKSTKTLFCGDLFTQPGVAERPLVADDILGPSQAMRAQLDDFSCTVHAPALFDKLARLQPEVLACMHGSAWQGDGGALLRALDQALRPR